jgi:ketosteroid isomerase-like protein
MSQNDEVIVRFYEGFAAKDADRMASCCHERIHFHDPVFQDLEGPDVMKMWRTLLGRSEDLEITLGDHGAEGDTGHAHWSAVYTFSQTGRVVHNEVDAAFRFEDGLIVDHRDSFDLWRWSRMALGAPGLLLGWSPIVKGRIRRQSAELLARA